MSAGVSTETVILVIVVVGGLGALMGAALHGLYANDGSDERENQRAQARWEAATPEQREQAEQAVARMQTPEWKEEQRVATLERAAKREADEAQGLDIWGDPHKHTSYCFIPPGCKIQVKP